MNSLKHGLGALLVIVCYTLVSTNAKYLPLEFEIESPDYERILRSDSGFSRILRSFGEDEGEDEQIAEESDSKRSFEPASFSRILRNSFSRILKRDPSSFTRILKRAQNSPSFSRILRQSGFSRILRSPAHERDLRAQQFSRILKKEDPDQHEFHRDAKNSGFSRIL